MEYVAGEDLASLAKRIGRLSPDKALDLHGSFVQGSRLRTIAACCIAI
jgi:hypothetical protein